MSSDNLLELFTSEFVKLEKLVNEINPTNQLPANQIVEVYYQITNISSMISVIKPQFDQNLDDSSCAKILNAEKFIS